MIDEAQPAEHAPPPKRVAETELILLLRNALAALTAPERELIALRFAAGLSQQEISRELKVPQQTISYRIEAILKRLRGLLPKGEQLFAAAPLAELLREAVLTGPAHPALPCPDVSRVPRYSSRHSQRVPRSASSHAWAPIAAGVGAVTLVTVLVVQQNSAPKALAVTPPPVTTTAPVSQPAEAAKAPPPAQVPPVAPDGTFAYRWTFEKMPGDLVPFGELSCDTKTKELVFGKAAVVAFPFRARKLPVLVRYSGVTTDRVAGSKFGVNVMSNTPNVPWDKLEVTGAKNIWAQTIPNSGGKLEFASYLFGDRLVDTANGYVCRVVKLEQPCDGNPLILLNTHCRLTWIEAKTIELRDIPEKYRTDIETLTRGMTPQALEFYAPGK